MAVLFKLTNPDDLPEDLADGKYATHVESAEWKGNDWIIHVRFDQYGDVDDCLFPLTKKNR